VNLEQVRTKSTATVKSLLHLPACFVVGWLLLSLLASCTQHSEDSGETAQALPDEAPVEMIEERTDIAFSIEPAPAPAAAPAPMPAPVIEERTGLTKEVGNILYNPPTEMTLNVSERVEVRIGKAALDETGLLGSGDIIRNEIPVSEYMTVRLCCGKPEEDQPFDIVPLNAERQIVEDEGFTQWAFDVTPRKKGRQLLNLSVSAHYTYANGEIRTKDNPIMTDQILVTVDTVQETQTWLSQHWQWLSLLLLIPLLVFYVLRSLKNNKNKPVALSGNESVFISYRRDDSSGYTLAIYEKLKAVMGDENVFMDMDDIPHGEDFAKHIEKVLSKANTVLVMIGEGWLNASNAQGRRLDDVNDFVRLEIATALKRGIRVIPVLLKNAQMPAKQELPEDLQDLCMRNGIRIHDDQFDLSIQRLIASVGR
jgi:hypothetical protein